MLLLLCALNDTDALWFADRARRSGTPVTVVTGELLAFARRRSHRLGRAGVRTSIELGDGLTISDEVLTGVINRLVEPPSDAWVHASHAERDYAMAELHAFTLSWLSSVQCPIRNQPDPSYLAGPAPHPLLAAAAARSAGFARASGPVRGGRSVHVVCLDGAPTTDLALPDEVHDGIGIFCRVIGAEKALIGLDFWVGPSGAWSFAGVAPLAQLPAGGTALLERLTRVLAAGNALELGATA